MSDEKKDGQAGGKVTPLTPSMYRRNERAANQQKAALPSPDDPYEASGTGDAHEQPVLVLIMGAPPYHAFEYVHVQNVVWDVTPGGEEVIRFVYAGFEPKRAAVYGDDLLRMWHQIVLRQIAWIRVARRDFRPVGAASAGPVITRIEVTDWTRPRPQAEDLVKALEEFEEA
jgi:hypothetical protein